MNQPDIPDQATTPPGDELPMPPLGDGDVQQLEPAVEPTSPAKQAAQLVVIPAVIVIICVGLATLFGKLAGAQESIDSHLMKLRQSSGSGRLAFGLQDPRYKDRWLAAYDIAVMIPKVHDPVEKLRISRTLVDVLDHNVGENEPILEAYLLMALGGLGQEGGLDAILNRLTAGQARTRQGAVSALLIWPDRAEAQMAVPGVLKLLEDQDPLVSASAATALGELTRPDQQQIVIDQLKKAMERPGAQVQDIRWNAAIALAKLGDPVGTRFVSEVLLDRQSLSRQLASDPTGQIRPESVGVIEDRVIMTALASAKSMEDQEIWDKIARIAEEDSNLSIRNAAQQLLLSRDEKSN